MLVTGVEPDLSVKTAMNAVEAAKRDRVTMETDAETYAAPAPQDYPSTALALS